VIVQIRVFANAVVWSDSKRCNSFLVDVEIRNNALTLLKLLLTRKNSPAAPALFAHLKFFQLLMLNFMLKNTTS
jgi:hypothetical protein